MRIINEFKTNFNMLKVSNHWKKTSQMEKNGSKKKEEQTKLTKCVYTTITHSGIPFYNGFFAMT